MFSAVASLSHSRSYYAPHASVCVCGRSDPRAIDRPAERGAHAPPMDVVFLVVEEPRGEAGGYLACSEDTTWAYGGAGSSSNRLTKSALLALSHSWRAPWWYERDRARRGVCSSESVVSSSRAGQVRKTKGLRRGGGGGGGSRRSTSLPWAGRCSCRHAVATAPWQRPGACVV